MKNNRKDRQHAGLIVACFLFSIAFLFTIWLRNAREFSESKESSCYITQWVLESPSGIRTDIILPTKISLEEEGDYTITAQMPEYAKEGKAALLLRTNSLNYEVRFSGKVIEKYQSSQAKFMMKRIDLIRLDGDYQGTIRITFTANLNTQNTMVLYPIAIGNDDSMYVSILQVNLPILLWYLLLGMAGGCAILLYLFLGKQEQVRMLWLAGFFAFTAAVYGISSNTLIKLVTQNAYFIYILQFLSQLFLPVTIMLIFMEKVEGRFQKGMRLFFYLICGNAAVQVICYLLFNSILPCGRMVTSLLYHGTFLIQFVYVIAARKRKGVRSGGIVICGWMVDLMLDDVQLVFSEHIFGITGMILYIGAKMQDVIREIRELKMEMYQVNLYRTLAYTDYLTKTNNRNALIEDMTYYNIFQGKCVWCVFIDLNNLKEINDQNGHMYGDQIIQEIAEMLRKEFEGCGKVYRIGGDEFIILVSDQDRSFMEQKIAHLKQYRKKGVSFAIGYDRLQEKESLEALIARADQLMYRDKRYDKNQA